MKKTNPPACSGDRPHNQLASLERKLGPITYRKIGELIAYEGNPRKHPEKQLAKLTASILEYGFAMPVLVDCDDVIIAGHGRLQGLAADAWPPSNGHLLFVDEVHWLLMV